VLGYKEMLRELSIDEKELWAYFHQRVPERLKQLDKQTQIRIMRELKILEEKPAAENSW
jgi:hypothetical protein